MGFGDFCGCVKTLANGGNFNCSITAKFISGYYSHLEWDAFVHDRYGNLIHDSDQDPKVLLDRLADALYPDRKNDFAEQDYNVIVGIT